MSTATRPAQDNFCLGTALLGEKPVPHLRSEDAVLKVLIYKVNRIPSCSTTFVDAQQNHQLSSCHSKLPHQDSLQPRFHLITSKHFYSTLAVQWKSHRVLICALAWEFSGIKMNTSTFAHVLLVAVCLPFLVAGQKGGGPHGGPMNGTLPLNGTLPDCEAYFNGTMPFNGTFNGTMPPFNNGSEPGHGMGRRGGPGSPMGAPFGAPRGAPPNMTNFNFTGLNGTFPCKPRGEPRNNQTATPTPTPTPTPTST